MENASKALIIAGAILLSILLISLGIMVYTNARGTVTEANLDSESAQTYNGKFTQYCGRKKSADDVNTLVQAIQSNNAANAKNRIKIVPSGLTSGTHYSVGGTIKEPSATAVGNYTYIFSNSYRYDVTYEITQSDTNMNKTGFIEKITVKVAAN